MDTKIIGFIGFVLVILVFYILPLFSKKEVESRKIIKEIKRKELKARREQEIEKEKEANERIKIEKQEQLEQKMEQKKLRDQKDSDLSKEIRQMPIYETWRKNVFEKYGKTCQECGSHERLEVHHKISFYQLLKHLKITSKERAINSIQLWSPDIGIVLCKVCHEKQDSSINYNKYNN